MVVGVAVAVVEADSSGNGSRSSLHAQSPSRVLCHFDTRSISSSGSISSNSSTSSILVLVQAVVV